MKFKLKALFALVAVTATASALDADLKVQFNFEQVSGTSVTDNISGATATLLNAAKVTEMGRYHVLDLGSSNGYLSMGSSVGTVFKSLTNFTVSCYYRVDKNASLSGNGFFLWSFSTSEACQSASGIYHAYRLNAQRVATSTGGYSHETGVSLDIESDKNSWIHVAYAQSGSKGTLYINGEEQANVSGMPIPSTVFTSVPAYNWIGRPPFSGDNYLKNTLVADFRIYGKALSAEEVQTLAAETESLNYDYRYGTPGDFSSLESAVATADARLASLDAAQYPPSAVMQYEDAVRIGHHVLDEHKVNQNAIDETVALLTSAWSTLSAVKGVVFDISGLDNDYDTNRGFRHPGGLHTQADFDRIKAQLAAGDETVTAAVNVLRSAAYAQASAATYPSETIVRGGDGENYINAARGASIAYQNALRWKIDGNRSCAAHAVDVLMAWARTTKYVSGTSDQCLARGLYGYEFAQAAELMRDFDGWSQEDFKTFCQWMLDVWYPGAIGFLRNRNGTWENVGKWWEAPGHYWSNWGLCNALCVISIGVLCDDVFIYNQGLSFIKYDQVGTYKDPRTDNPIRNDGLTEFWGNLVVTTGTWSQEMGAYGKVGQTNESGRDTGHAAMALGLAVDIAHQGWNQGDDLFSWMDHRIAAGIEYVAAQCQGIENLPWTNYHYANNGYYWTDSRAWLMTAPALGAQLRPYWGTVIGHYEGVKGVKMPFSEWCAEQVGIDGGGMGGTSGGYDHLGYSVLMNYRDHMATAEERPTELTPEIAYNGRSYQRNDAGGLTNTYKTTAEASRALPVGTNVTLTANLPAGESDTGLWEWSTGATTRSISVEANASQIYRVTYTNGNGVKSEQNFSIAVQGDCHPSTVTPYITTGGITVQTDEITVLYGESVTLSVVESQGYGNCLWSNGSKDYAITMPAVTGTRDVQCYVSNQGGRHTAVNFHINVLSSQQQIIVDGTPVADTQSVTVDCGSNVVFKLNVPQALAYGEAVWEDGTTGFTYTMSDISASQEHTLRYTLNGETKEYPFSVTVQETARELSGAYAIRHRESGRLLTAGTSLTFEPQKMDGETLDASQQWTFTTSGNTYTIQDSNGKYISGNGALIQRRNSHNITFLAPYNYAAVNAATGTKFWQMTEAFTLQVGPETELQGYPFEIITAEEATGIREVKSEERRVKNPSNGQWYDLSGRKVTKPKSGLYILNGEKVFIP